MTRPPKLRVLSQISASIAPKTNQILETVWEIDVRNTFWSLALSYLMTVPDDVSKVILKSALQSELHMKNRIIKAKVRNIRKNIRKCNPFRNKYDIQKDRSMKIFQNYLKTLFLSNCDENNWRSILQNASNYFKCIIYLYSIDSQGKCLFSSLLEPKEFHHNCPRLILFCHSQRTLNPSMPPKFNFGLPPNFAQYIRQKDLFKILQDNNFAKEEEDEIKKAISSAKNFLIPLLQSSSTNIIPLLYKPPYIARKLAEIGFAVDPRLPDENGFSAFHYCMDLPNTRLIWLLYNFAANIFYLKDYNVRNPNDKINNTLKEIGQIIEKDISRDQNISPIYKKTAGQILRFNQYQRELTEEIFRLKQVDDLHFFKMKMVSIFKKYEEFFYFKSPLCNHSPDLENKLELFKNFVSHSEYHENLDIFTFMVFCDQLPHINGYINESNENIFSDTLSSIFLSMLSNNFFPKYEHKNNACNCGLLPEICEQNNNAQRFVAFYYRKCFLTKSIALKNELKKDLGNPQSSNDLLKTITKSLANLPEIEDAYLIFRAKFYLKSAIDTSDQDNKYTRMLTFERTFQIIGEILQNETVSKTIIRFLVSSCIPSELIKGFIKMRHHCFCHYRSSSVQGRINLESRGHTYLDNIHKELCVFYQATKFVSDSQRFRVEEFLIEKCKIHAGNICKNIASKLDKVVENIRINRKHIIMSRKGNFCLFLCSLFKYATKELETLKEFTDFKDLSESINYLLQFVASHWEEYSKDLLQIRDELYHFVSSVESSNMTDHIKLQLNEILSENLKFLEGMFGSSLIYQLPCNSTYLFLPSIFSEMKDFDPFSPKEKIKIKEEILKFVETSNKNVQKLIEDCSTKRGVASLAIFDGLIVPEDKRVILWDCFSTIYKMNKLDEVFCDTKQISNRTLFNFLCSNLDVYEIFLPNEIREFQKLYEYWHNVSYHLSRRPLQEFMNNESEIFYDQNPVIKVLKDRLNKIFDYENNRHRLDKSISKKCEIAGKELHSKKFMKVQKIETWYNDSNDGILNFKLNKEEHMSVFLKISLPRNLKNKLIKILNQKVLFLINRINHMKRLLISEDETILPLWVSNSWKHNKDAEKHLKSLMVQRYLTENGVKVALEMLLLDCILILNSDDYIDLWKKANSMFIGSDMIQILAHGNPIIETAGSLLDPTDLSSDIIDKILNLIEDAFALRSLSSVWIQMKTCKEGKLKEYISNANTPLCLRIKKCPRWEKYFKLLPLKR